VPYRKLMAPLRILHVINVPWFNAVAWYGVQTAVAQQKQGHLLFVAGDPDSPSVTEADRLGIEHTLRLSFSTPNPLKQWFSARKLRSFIEEHKIDIVNAHQGNGYYAIAYATKTAKNRPILVRTRGDIRWPKNNGFNRKLYAEWSDGIIATSQVTSDRMTQTFAMPASQVRVILPAVDIDYFKRGDGAEEADASEPFPVFGLVGRIDKIKGHKIVLAAFQKISKLEPNVRLVVAGPEQDVSYESLKGYAREHHLVQRIFFLGPVSDVRDVMRICDCGIIASTESEAICRVALEFMAMRVPVIASNLHGIPDVVKPAGSGTLFETGNVDDLAGKMREFLARKNEWRNLKNNARKWVEENFTFDRIGRESIEFYETLLTRRINQP